MRTDCLNYYDCRKPVEECKITCAEYNKPHKHPGDFFDKPSDEQMEYFKRGGR